MDLPEREVESSLSSSHIPSKLYLFTVLTAFLSFITLFLFSCLCFLTCFAIIFGRFKVNTRQQTERDPAKERRKLGTIEQMCQVLASITVDWTLIPAFPLFLGFLLSRLVWVFLYLLNVVQVVKHEGWDRLYGGLTPSLVGTAASQVSPFYLFLGLFLWCACS